MRVLGIDVGRRRMGFAISDATRTLARPLVTVTIAPGADEIECAVAEVARRSAEEDGIDTVVVGMPKRLDGSPNDETPRVVRFIAALRERTAMDVVPEDERLTSRDAESRLAVRERDWKKRKKRLDAAAAAVILQDYLDRHK